MPMFGCYEIFTFELEGQILEMKIHPADCQKFSETIYIPYLKYERQPNQVQPQLFGDSKLFHHYLLDSMQTETHALGIGIGIEIPPVTCH